MMILETFYFAAKYPALSFLTLIKTTCLQNSSSVTPFINFKQGRTLLQLNFS